MIGVMVIIINNYDYVLFSIFHHLQSPPKVLEWQGQFLCFRCILKTFQFQIKRRIWDNSSEFAAFISRYWHLDVLNNSGQSTFSLNPPTFQVITHDGRNLTVGYELNKWRIVPRCRRGRKNTPIHASSLFLYSIIFAELQFSSVLSADTGTKYT